MAALTITSIVPVAASGLVYGDGIAGGTITLAQVCYRDATDSYKLKTASSLGLATADVAGLALSSVAVSGAPVRIIRAGDVTLGTTMVVGMWYCLGQASGIVPITDIAIGDYVTSIGYAKTATVMRLAITATGIVSATNI